MNKQDVITVPVAIGAITWAQIHKYLEWASGEAQLLLPLLGGLWLIVQIAAKIYNTWIKKQP